MYTNAGIDMKKILQQKEDYRISAQFDEEHARAERAALIDAAGGTLAGPEIVEAGSEAHVGLEFSYENDPGKEMRERQRIREARAQGHLKPRQIVLHEDHVEMVYDGDHPIAAFAQKLFCIRCRDAVSETEHEQRMRHERIKATVPYPYEVPENVMDYCGTCGAQLGGQQEVA